MLGRGKLLLVTMRGGYGARCAVCGWTRANVPTRSHGKKTVNKTNAKSRLGQFAYGYAHPTAQRRRSTVPPFHLDGGTARAPGEGREVGHAGIRGSGVRRPTFRGPAPASRFASPSSPPFGQCECLTREPWVRAPSRREPYIQRSRGGRVGGLKGLTGGNSPSDHFQRPAFHFTHACQLATPGSVFFPSFSFSNELSPLVCSVRRADMESNRVAPRQRPICVDLIDGSIWVQCIMFRAPLLAQGCNGTTYPGHVGALLPGAKNIVTFWGLPISFRFPK